MNLGLFTIVICAIEIASVLFFRFRGNINDLATLAIIIGIGVAEALGVIALGIKEDGMFLVIFGVSGIEVIITFIIEKVVERIRHEH